MTYTITVNTSVQHIIRLFKAEVYKSLSPQYIIYSQKVRQAPVESHISHIILVMATL